MGKPDENVNLSHGICCPGYNDLCLSVHVCVCPAVVMAAVTSTYLSFIKPVNLLPIGGSLESPAQIQIFLRKGLAGIATGKKLENSSCMTKFSFYDNI